MKHYAHWFRPQAKMYKLERGENFTSTRMMLNLRKAVRAARDHDPSFFEYKARFEELLLALYEFRTIDFEAYYNVFHLSKLLNKIYERNSYKEIF